MEKKHYIKDMLLKAIYAGKGVDFFDTVDKDTLLVESPNNVRALVLSPEGFVMFQWTDNDLNRPTAVKSFPLDSDKVTESLASGNFLEVLTKPRVCSHFEELIVLASTTGSEETIGAKALLGVYDLRNELNRLRSIRVVKSFDGTTEDFMQELLEGMKSSSERFACLHSVVDGMGVDVVKVFTNEDFYKTPVALRPKYYKLDERGGLLSIRLKERQAEIEALHSVKGSVGDTYEDDSDVEEVDEVEDTSVQALRNSSSVDSHRYVSVCKVIIALLELGGLDVARGDAMIYANNLAQNSVDSRLVASELGQDKDLALKMLRMKFVAMSSGVSLSEDSYNNLVKNILPKALLVCFGNNLELIKLHIKLLSLTGLELTASDDTFDKTIDRYTRFARKGSLHDLVEHTGFEGLHVDQHTVDEFVQLHRKELNKDILGLFKKAIAACGDSDFSRALFVLMCGEFASYHNVGGVADKLYTWLYTDVDIRKEVDALLGSARDRETEALRNEALEGLRKLQSEFENGERREFPAFKQGFVGRSLELLIKGVEKASSPFEVREVLSQTMGKIMRDLYDGDKFDRSNLGIRVSCIRLGDNGRQSVSFYGSGLTMQELRSICMVTVSVNLTDRRYSEVKEYLSFIQQFLDVTYNSPRDILGDEVMDEIIGVRKEDREKFNRGERLE